MDDGRPIEVPCFAFARLGSNQLINNKNRLIFHYSHRGRLIFHKDVEQGLLLKKVDWGDGNHAESYTRCRSY